MVLKTRRNIITVALITSVPWLSLLGCYHIVLNSLISDSTGCGVFAGGGVTSSDLVVEGDL